jgi:hypothetical protein
MKRVRPTCRASPVRGRERTTERMSRLISRQEAKARGRATTAASEQLRRMLEDSLRLDDAIERLELLEHATDMLLRTLDHELGRRSLPFPLKLQMETVEQLLDAR